MMTAVERMMAQERRAEQQGRQQSAEKALDYLSHKLRAFKDT
jgi:hypothetical protein